MIRLTTFLVAVLLFPSSLLAFGIGTNASLGHIAFSSVAPNEAFEFVMRTTTATETVTLPFTAYTDIDIDWGDGGSVENFTTGTVSHEYATADDYSISITGSATAFSFDNGGDRLKLISVSNLGDLGWTAFGGGFFGCTNMTSFAAGDTDTSLVTNMYAMFLNCSSLTSLDLGSLFDTSIVTNMSSMFRGFSSLTSLDLGSLFDTSLVTNMYAMFLNCSSLTSLDLGSLFDTSLVTNMSSMFLDCSSLDIDVSNFDITSLSNATNMFSGSGFGDTNYDLLLVAWEAQTEPEDVTFHAGSAQYGSGSPATARAALVSSGWTITDGGAQ